MKLALCVSTYNRVAYLERLIKSFYDTFDTSYDWRVIVTDDGSTDGTKAYLETEWVKRNIPFIEVVHSWRRGVHHAKNQALMMLDGTDFDVAFFCDDDIYFKRVGWEMLYMRAMNEGPKHLIYYNLDFRPTMEHKIITNGRLESRCNAHYVQGAFFTVTPEIIKRVGYMDCINYGLAYGGHVDYSVRCMRAGFSDFETPWDATGSVDFIGMHVKDDYKPSVDYGERGAREGTPRKMELKRRLLRDPERIYIPYNETTERWDTAPEPEPPAAVVAPVKQRKETKTKLHLGCGDNILPGWINMDAYVNAPGVLQEDIRKLRYPDGMMDEVLAEDVLEHFSRREWKDVLREWVRVLKPGGKITIRVPDMKKLCEQLISASSIEDFEKWNRRIFGDQGREGMTHFTGFAHPYFRDVCEAEFGIAYIEHMNENCNVTYRFEKR